MYCTYLFVLVSLVFRSLIIHFHLYSLYSEYVDMLAINTLWKRCQCYNRVNTDLKYMYHSSCGYANICANLLWLLQIFWNSIGSLSQKLYLGQLIDSRRQNNVKSSPIFFLSFSLKVLTLLISNMSSGTSSYIFFKDISCYCI